MDWKRLFHRWFVEYNPLYLLSAALVLRGVNMLSAGLLRGGHVLAALCIPAIAEAYAWGLIGAAALLMRVRLRRPAVMLTLLAVLYQGDLTLHTETCAYLGTAGWVAAIAWLASFVAKLFALSRVMRLRVPRMAFAVPTLGAVGLVVVPRLTQHVSADAGSALVACWVYGAVAAGLWATPRIQSRESLDDWGVTVLRRASRATWSIWVALLLVHSAFWMSSRAMDGSALVAMAPLLGARYAKGPRQMWLAATGTLGVVALAAPAFLPLAAWLAFVTFGLHVLTRTAHGEPITSLVAGAVTCAYVALSFPAHVLWLEVPFTATLVLLAWKRRAWAVLTPAALNLVHHAVTAKVVTAPVSTFEWGVWSVAAGFVLLGATLATSIRIHQRAIAPCHPYRDPSTG